ncbi:RNA polymerase-binding protein DksA [Desulfobacterales bacterium HSG16]|nr:RNA polymerase-binding protein DksA [Desulfobacterales bacterium HSG16]
MIIEIPGDYRPSENEQYMNNRQIEYFRLKLLRWREQLIEDSQKTLQRLKEEDLGIIESVDRGVLEFDTAFELRTRDRYRKLLVKIDKALGRIGDGTYGYCEDTEEEIGIRRLEARPIATLSIEAQEQHERDEKKWA